MMTVLEAKLQVIFQIPTIIKVCDYVIFTKLKLGMRIKTFFFFRLLALLKDLTVMQNISLF